MIVVQVVQNLQSLQFTQNIAMKMSPQDLACSKIMFLIHAFQQLINVLMLNQGHRYDIYEFTFLLNYKE